MGDGYSADAIALEIIGLMEQAKTRLEALREGAMKMENPFDARNLSVAITYLEDSQLRLANARPE